MMTLNFNKGTVVPTVKLDSVSEYHEEKLHETKDFVNNLKNYLLKIEKTRKGFYKLNYSFTSRIN